MGEAVNRIGRDGRGRRLNEGHPHYGSGPGGEVGVLKVVAPRAAVLPVGGARWHRIPQTGM